MSVESSPAERAHMLRAALRDADPRVRGAAARVAAVTGARDLVRDVRSALAKEKNIESAREEIRAIGIDGGVKEIDALLAASMRFGSRLDVAAWKAVARGGGAEAIDVLIANDEADLLPYALWGRPDAIASAASRVLAKASSGSWSAWLERQTAAGLPLDARVAAQALTSSNAEIAAATAWHLAMHYASVPPGDPKTLLDAIDKSQDTGFGLELLARALGRAPRERDEWLVWLASSEGHTWRVHAAATLLTPAEVKASNVPDYMLHLGKPQSRFTPPGFSIMDNVPQGVTGEVMAKTACDGAWDGVASVQVDDAGRVQSADLSRVNASSGCRKALNVLIRNSLASDMALSSGFRNDHVVLVHAGAAEACFDESDVRATIGEMPMRVGARVTPPRKTRNVDPQYPETSRQAREEGIVIVESRINAIGCVGSMRILKSLSPGLDHAALVALSQWRFTPALYDGEPVDVIYNLTISFKLK